MFSQSEESNLIVILILLLLLLLHGAVLVVCVRGGLLVDLLIVRFQLEVAIFSLGSSLQTARICDIEAILLRLVCAVRPAFAISAEGWSRANSLLLDEFLRERVKQHRERLSCIVRFVVKMIGEFGALLTGLSRTRRLLRTCREEASCS